MKIKLKKKDWWVIALVIGALFIGLYPLQYKLDGDAEKYKCPNDYDTAEEYLNTLALWIRTAMDENPEKTTEEITELRIEELIAHKCEDSKWIEGDNTTKEIGTRYGRLVRFSTSGSMMFKYYDIEKDEVIDEEYYSFYGYFNEYEDIEFIASQSWDTIYKLEGILDEPWQYWEGKPPLEMMDVTKWEIYKIGTQY